MTIIQPLLPEDAPAAAAMRQAALPHKGERLGPEARPMFDTMFAATPAAADMRVEPATVGGIPGFWVRSRKARARELILYVHGGGYVLGSVQAVTNFAGQIAVRVDADAFVADYRLAPEHPFPAAIDDVVAAYLGLVAEGAERIVVVGDSAGAELGGRAPSKPAVKRAAEPRRPLSLRPPDRKPTKPTARSPGTGTEAATTTRTGTATAVPGIGPPPGRAGGWVRRVPGMGP
jgi:acetyl esterase/lipase